LKRVFKTSARPVDLHLSTRSPLNTTLITRPICHTIWALTQHSAEPGLAAALKRKPTVARYTLYFRRLQAACFDNESGPYGEARRYHVIIMCDNFPENAGSKGENMIRKSLKKRKLLSVSFPKRLVLGQVVPHMAAQSLP